MIPQSVVRQMTLGESQSVSNSESFRHTFANFIDGNNDKAKSFSRNQMQDSEDSKQMCRFIRTSRQMLATNSLVACDVINLSCFLLSFNLPTV